MEIGELYPRVAIEAPGVAIFNINEAVAYAAGEFFRETRAWRESFGPLVYDKDQIEYTVTLPTDTILVEPTRVELDGNGLKSEYFWAVGTDSIGVDAGPSGKELEGEIAVSPTENRSELPTRLLVEFGEAIIHGALARLLRVPQAEWSNGALSDYYRALFEEEKIRAATRVENGFKANRTRVVRYGGL